jgi:hypothetical protein
VLFAFQLKIEETADEVTCLTHVNSALTTRGAAVPAAMACSLALEPQLAPTMSSTITILC